MKITFVRPNLYAGRSHDAMEPLCFAILQSLTPPDVETSLYDERIEDIGYRRRKLGNGHCQNVVEQLRSSWMVDAQSAKC